MTVLSQRIYRTMLSLTAVAPICLMTLGSARAAGMDPDPREWRLHVPGVSLQNEAAKNHKSRKQSYDGRDRAQRKDPRGDRGHYDGSRSRVVETSGYRDWHRSRSDRDHDYHRYGSRDHYRSYSYGWGQRYPYRHYTYRPYPYRPYRGHYWHHYSDDAAFAWLALPVLGLFAVHYLTEHQQHAHAVVYQQATTAPLGEPIYWQDGDAAGNVTATRDGHDTAGRYCREFQSTITVGGKRQSGYGTACRQPDGTWEIVKQQQ